MEQTYAYEDLLELVKELKNELKNISLQLATREQQKADEDVLTLLKKQEQEKNDAFNRIIHLEKQLDAKQKLERKIQQLKGKLQVMKHMGDEEDVAVKKKMEDMDEELKEKTEEMEELEAMNQTLLIKERKINDELQEARKELISGLNDLLSNRTMIGIKRMGELDAKSFQNACKERFPKDAEIKAAELCSKWEDELRNPSWHPFQIINVEGKIQNELKNNSLQLATREQQKADEDVLTLLKKQEQEKKDAFKRIIHLEKQLDAKQKLELEIQQLKGKLQVMKHMRDEEDVAVKKKMEEMGEELKEKTEEMEDLEAMNQTLLIKERKSNDELQEAHQFLISDLCNLSSNPTMIGIKRMGELDAKSFQNACKERFPKDTEIKAAELCSKWEDELRKPDWHPFQIINVEGKHQEVIKEDDEKLQELKQELGQEAYNAVTRALLEMNEYNTSGRYIVLKIWNFKEKRKATIKEIIQTHYILKQGKTQKRKRTT